MGMLDLIKYYTELILILFSFWQIWKQIKNIKKSFLFVIHGLWKTNT